VLGTLGGNQSHAAALNDRGQVVGFSTDGNGHAHMFLWEAGSMIDPMDHLVSGDGWGGRASALDINEAGQIVGTAFRDGYDAPAVLTPVDLELSDLVPGVAGQVNTLEVTGLTPGRRAHLVFGATAGMTRIPGCPGATVLVSTPRLGGTFTADAEGTVHVERAVPSRFSGRSFVLQAVERSSCKVSNLVRVTLE
jgi:probable HAF family extracellular repeat protein